MSRSQHTIHRKCLSSGLLVNKLVPASHSHTEKSWFWSKCRVTVFISIPVFTFYLNASVIGTLSQINRGENAERGPCSHTSLPERGQLRPQWKGIPSSRSHKEAINRARMRCQHLKPIQYPFQLILLLPQRHRVSVWKGDLCDMSPLKGSRSSLHYLSLLPIPHILNERAY